MLLALLSHQRDQRRLEGPHVSVGPVPCNDGTGDGAMEIAVAHMLLRLAISKSSKLTISSLACCRNRHTVPLG